MHFLLLLKTHDGNVAGDTSEITWKLKKEIKEEELCFFSITWVGTMKMMMNDLAQTVSSPLWEADPNIPPLSSLLLCRLRHHHLISSSGRSIIDGHLVLANNASPMNPSRRSMQPPLNLCLNGISLPSLPLPYVSRTLPLLHLIIAPLSSWSRHEWLKWTLLTLQQAAVRACVQRAEQQIQPGQEWWPPVHDHHVQGSWVDQYDPETGWVQARMEDFDFHGVVWWVRRRGRRERDGCGWGVRRSFKWWGFSVQRSHLQWWSPSFFSF